MTRLFLWDPGAHDDAFPIPLSSYTAVCRVLAASKKKGEKRFPLIFQVLNMRSIAFRSLICKFSANCCIYGYTVEPLLTDPPRSGLPLNNGHTSRNGMISHRSSVFLTSEKRQPLYSEQRTKSLSQINDCS